MKQDLDILKDLASDKHQDYSYYVDTSSRFFDKLTALSSGSIATAATISGILLNKQPVNLDLIHWLFYCIVSFFFSLLFALASSYLAMLNARFAYRKSSDLVSEHLSAMLKAITQHLENSSPLAIEISPIPVPKFNVDKILQRAQQTIALFSALFFCVGYGIAIYRLYILIFENK